MLAMKISLVHDLAFGAYSLWWDALLSLNTWGMGLILPQLKLTDLIVDLPTPGELTYSGD